MLVYEMLSGGDVCKRIHQCLRDERNFPWEDRLSVAYDAASGLSHLHNSNPKAFHRDIKSANILLDRKGTAKMADFGLACLAQPKQESTKVNQASGTVGYACPYYIQKGVVDASSEVYSFGMVLLELLTALPPACPGQAGQIMYLVHHIDNKLDRVLNMVDQKAGWPPSVAHEIATLALSCISMTTSLRPNFVVILRKLRELLNMEVPTPEASANGNRPNVSVQHQQQQQAQQQAQLYYQQVQQQRPAPQQVQQPPQAHAQPGPVQAQIPVVVGVHRVMQQHPSPASRAAPQQIPVQAAIVHQVVQNQHPNQHPNPNPHQPIPVQPQPVMQHVVASPTPAPVVQLVAVTPQKHHVNAVSGVESQVVQLPVWRVDPTPPNSNFFFSLKCEHSDGIDLSHCSAEILTLAHHAPNTGQGVPPLRVGRLWLSSFFQNLMTDQFFNSVSRQHFEIWTQERANYTAVVLTNYSGNGTVVNNVIIQKGYIFSI